MQPSNRRHPTSRSGLIRAGSLAVTMILVIVMIGYILIQSATSKLTATESQIIPFPIGVNPQTKTITEQPLSEQYLSHFIASNHTKSPRFDGWLAKARATIESFAWYQQLAAPRSRTIVVWSGERAEQVTTSFAQILDWTPDEAMEFRQQVAETEPSLQDGKFYPDRYVFHDNTTATSAAAAVVENFTTQVQDRYSPEIAAQVPLADAMIIASLIEREAYDFNDMRYISGVIWNRLFIGMPLQLDATLQYARGVPGTNRTWWPIPVPRDKFIDSPFNTYQNIGLPPEPISNPSVDAIIAALNPRETDCLFYFHDARGGFHCTETYEEHVQLLREYY